MVNPSRKKGDYFFVSSTYPVALLRWSRGHCQENVKWVMVLHTPPPVHADWCSFFAGLYLWVATISNEKKSICMGAWLIVTSTLLGLVINALFNLPIPSSSKNHFSGSDEWSFFHQLLEKSCITARKNNSMTFLKLCKIAANFVFKRITRIETT